MAVNANVRTIEVDATTAEQLRRARPSAARAYLSF
jgi:hypothetical protein